MRETILTILRGDYSMKHLLFLTVLSLIGAIGAVVHPFYGVLVYYILAILRPQCLWAWGLPAEIRWSLLAATAAMIGLLLSLPRIVVKSRWNPLATLIIVFGILMLISTINAINSAVATRWATEYAKIFVMSIIATIVIDRLRYIRYISLMIMLTIGYLAWEMNSLYFFDNRLDIYNNGLGGMDNNGSGLLIAMGIPFAYAFWRIFSSYTAKVLCVFMAILMIHAVMMSYSRGAMLSACVGLIWLLYHHRPRFQLWFLALGFAVVIVFLAGPEIRQRFISIGNYKSDNSVISRIESWSAAWNMAWDHPLTGVGIRNANLFGANYGTDSSGRTIHSQYLQTAADSGIPSLIIYLGICGLAIRNMSRVRMIAENSIGIITKGSHDAMEWQPPEHTASIAIAIQASLIIFIFGGLFLSLEVFELPWLMFVLAGVMPGLAEQEYYNSAEAQTAVTYIPAKSGLLQLRPRISE